MISDFEQTKLITKGIATWDEECSFDIQDDFDLTITATKKLNGSVTMKKGSFAEMICNFQTVVMTDSEVVKIENVSNVTINKGNSVICSYVGTKGKDTLTISKGAVLIIDKIDFAGGKDKLTNNGTLILKKVINLATLPISGKGEIAATDSVYQSLTNDDKEIVINVGETALGFRNTAYENSDDTQKKAIKWDTVSDYQGWLGNWNGAKDGSDNVDYITFKVKENAKLTLDFGGADVGFALLDPKGNNVTVSVLSGNTITQAGQYILELKLDEYETNTVSYSIKLA